MTRQRKVLVWSAAVLGGLLALGALTALVVRDLDTADKLASVVGALAGSAGLAVSLRALSLSRRAPDAAATGPVVTAEGERSVAVGGTLSGTVVTGDGRSTGTLPPPRPSSGGTRPGSGPPAGVRTPGARSVAVGGDVSGTVVTGDEGP
ncbi:MULTISPECIES: hypothetical protein [unclassified Streptomyces]|uniref:hypothetical protein n=1 Tax=unclassified Streptomyces TaxID=2593676 RepID=UPI0033E99C25